MYTNCSSTNEVILDLEPPPPSPFTPLQHPPTIVTFVDETVLNLNQPVRLQRIQRSDADDLKRMQRLTVADGLISGQFLELTPPHTIMSNEPFLQENLIGFLLKKAGVGSLKGLRKMDEKWLNLGNNELEKRSKKGQLKPVEFSKDNFQEDLKLFLKDTESNPKLFKSFRLGFQDAFKFLDASFFANYRPQFLQLDLPRKSSITQDAGQYLGELLGWISEDIQELKVHILEPIGYDQKKVSPVAFQTPLVFPNLRKFTFRQNYEFKPKSFIKHFYCILDRSREVDPTPNLTFLEIEPENEKNLEHFFGSNPPPSTVLSRWFGWNPIPPIALSRWSTLTHLSLHSACNFQRVSSLLLSLASAGMSLQSLSLYCEPQEAGLNFVAICSDLSRFFATQAKSLKILKLEFGLGEEYDYEVREPFGVIRWPLFENVHTLKLNYPFFDMGPIPVHFPSVQNLTFDTYLDPKTMFPDGIQPLSIHTLDIGYSQACKANPKINGVKAVDEWILWLEGKFQSVVHLTCSNKWVEIGRLPWSDTLEVLELKYNLHGPIKIGHLKALKKLVIANLSGLMFVKKAWFDEALVLNLSSITFKCFDCHMPSIEMKDEFSANFPFPIQFQEIPDFDE